MKAIRTLLRILPFLLVAAVFLAVAFYPKRATADGGERTIVEVWNVDTFEGGKGSRTAFLSRVAKRIEREDPNVLYHVQSYTAEGALAAIRGGIKPDVLSYGIGLCDISEYLLPLPFIFSGAERGGKCLAVPWCRGKYMLFSRSDLEGNKRTAVSCGGENLPAVAAALAAIEGEELPSSEAYTSFLGGEYDLLFGTQRDLCRFRARGVEVNMLEYDGYCDLFQCASILKERALDLSLRFLEALLSGETKSELSSIGMYPPETEKNTRTADLFSGREALDSLAETARRGGSGNFLDKFLKII